MTLSLEFQLENNWLAMSKWRSIQVSPHPLNDEESTKDPLQIVVPLLPGKKLTIHREGIPKQLISPYQDDEAMREVIHYDASYDIYNGPLLYEGVKEESSTITTPKYTRNILFASGTYRQNRVFLDMSEDQRLSYMSENPDSRERVSDERLTLPSRLNNRTRRKANRLLEGIGIRSERIGRVPILSIVSSIYDFVYRNRDGKSIIQTDDIDAYDAEWLIEQYNRVQLFPGDCKSSAAIVAACCDSLNLPVRILDGCVSSTLNLAGAGHVWPEVYLPLIQRWIPVDAAMGTLLEYPSKDLIYWLKGTLPYNISDAKIKVTSKTFKQSIQPASIPLSPDEQTLKAFGFI